MVSDEQKRVWQINYDTLAERIVANADVAALISNVAALASRLTEARAGYIDELAAANLPNDIDALLMRLSEARAGYLDAISRDRPDMIFWSTTGIAIIVLPAVGGVTDIDFPSVPVDTLPSGITIAKADWLGLVADLFDTSAAENQVAAAGKTVRVKKSTGGWATPADQMVAYTFLQNGLQVDGDGHRAGPILGGGIDIKAIVDGNATYNFRSEQTNNSEGVYVTGASLELLDVSSIIRVWFN